MPSKFIGAEQETLLNIGKICGWIEASAYGDNFRYSIARLGFGLKNGGLKADQHDSTLLSTHSNHETAARFIKVFLTPPRDAGSMAGQLQAAHKALFSHKEGFQHHPGEWVSASAAEELTIFFDELSQTATSPFVSAVHVNDHILQLHPFKDGNRVMATLAANYYLQSLGVIPYPLFPFHTMPNAAEADRWFAEQTAAMLGILEKIRKLTRVYEDRTNGLSTQRKKLFSELLPYMMRRPQFGIQELRKDFGKSTYQTMNELARELSESPISILNELTGLGRHRVFHLREYTNLFKPLI